MQVINKAYHPEVPVGDLVPHPSNYNMGDLLSIGESIDINGFYGAVLARAHPTIPGKFQILAGEHRWKSAIAAGAATVPVLEVEADDEVAAARILLSDNETAKRSTYDTGKLDELIATIGSIDGTGLSLDDLGDHEDRRKQDDDPPPGDDGGDFQREFGVIVIVENEQEQRAMYEEFKSRGLSVRVASI